MRLAAVIMADPDWHGGSYLEHDTHPQRGLAIARMVAHITYLSEPSLQKRFAAGSRTGTQTLGLTPTSRWKVIYGIKKYLSIGLMPTPISHHSGDGLL